MGVDYYYCGECCESLHSDCFSSCYNENCCEEYDHDSGHGLYCIDCGLAKKMFIQRHDMIFCNKKCYNIFVLEKSKDIEKCAYCKKEKPYYEFKNIIDRHKRFCDYDCREKYDDMKK